MEVFTVREKESKLKVGDVIEVTMSIDAQIPEGDFNKPLIDLNDYDIKYEVNYYYPNHSGSTEVDFTDEAGCSTCSDIKDYLENYAKNDIEEIDEYELFDVDNDGEYQTAKIRVKSVKES